MSCQVQPRVPRLTQVQPQKMCVSSSHVVWVRALSPTVMLAFLASVRERRSDFNFTPATRLRPHLLHVAKLMCKGQRRSRSRRSAKTRASTEHRHSTACSIQTVQDSKVQSPKTRTSRTPKDSKVQTIHNHMTRIN
jgi:hypothetical protein